MTRTDRRHIGAARAQGHAREVRPHQLMLVVRIVSLRVKVAPALAYPLFRACNSEGNSSLAPQVFFDIEDRAALRDNLQVAFFRQWQ